MNTQTYVNHLNTAAQQHESAYRESVPQSDEQTFHKTRMTALNKALAEAIGGNIPQAVDGVTWLVHSRTNSRNVYRVDTNAWTCTCEAGLARRDCWHIHAAQIAQEADAAPVPIVDPFDSEKQTAPGLAETAYPDAALAREAHTFADMGETPPDDLDDFLGWLGCEPAEHPSQVDA